VLNFADEMSNIQPTRDPRVLLGVGASCWWDETKAMLKMFAFMGQQEVIRECPESPRLRRAVRNLAKDDGYELVESPNTPSVIVRPLFKGLKLKLIKGGA